MNIKLPFNVEIGSKLTLIGGPCVAESWEVCCEIATYLKELCLELDVNYIFKASYDKANRSSVDSFRGLGMEAGLQILEDIRHELQVPVVTDVHETAEVAPVVEVVDILQIPAFLCRQTDLLVAAGNSGKVVNIKKGQFMAPEDMQCAVDKVMSTGNEQVMLTERGTTFGYHNLVVDMRGLATMGEIGLPVVFDATHSVQLPGGLGNASGGQREFIRPLARAAAAVGIDVLFAEVHPNPEQAMSDGPNSLSFDDIAVVLREVKEIYDIQRKNR
ncbi:MAG: 3-deoxy-8-phosphooctulonate synthase [Victivallaceae bacterium]|nr:3-deoxy-8-phosphooctulonate synthase [Victivallaceae bacterium]